MKRKTKSILRALARHFGLKVIFVHYLPEEVYGKLLPREKRILINAHKPRCEHAFTLLHELAHYILHVLGRHRKRYPWIFDIHWKNECMARFSSVMRRTIRFTFNRESGREWEADLWALCAFVQLSNADRCTGELKAFLERHPEKMPMATVVIAVSAWHGIKTRLKQFFRNYVGGW